MGIVFPRTDSVVRNGVLRQGSGALVGCEPQDAREAFDPLERDLVQP